MSNILNIMAMVITASMIHIRRCPIPNQPDQNSSAHSKTPDSGLIAATDSPNSHRQIRQLLNIVLIATIVTSKIDFTRNWISFKRNQVNQCNNSYVKMIIEKKRFIILCYPRNCFRAAYVLNFCIND